MNSPESGEAAPQIVYPYDIPYAWGRMRISAGIAESDILNINVPPSTAGRELIKPNHVVGLSVVMANEVSAAENYNNANGLDTEILIDLNKEDTELIEKLTQERTAAVETVITDEVVGYFRHTYATAHLQDKLSAKATAQIAGDIAKRVEAEEHTSLKRTTVALAGSIAVLSMVTASLPQEGFVAQYATIEYPAVIGMAGMYIYARSLVTNEKKKGRIAAIAHNSRLLGELMKHDIDLMFNPNNAVGNLQDLFNLDERTPPRGPEA